MKKNIFYANPQRRSRMIKYCFLPFCTLLLLLSCRTIPLPSFSDLPRSVDIILQNPDQDIGVDLIKALKLRKSTKLFSTKEIGLREISAVLWSANGINRENGRRTAPSPFAKDLISIYVFSNIGIYRYDARQNKLIFLSDKNKKKDIGAKSGARGIKTASHVLLLTADLSQFPDFITRDVRLNSAHATAGSIGQNIYLIANSLDLRTRFVGSINEEGIRASLELREDEAPLYIMPLGYKK